MVFHLLRMNPGWELIDSVGPAGELGRILLMGLPEHVLTPLSPSFLPSFENSFRSMRSGVILFFPFFFF